MSALQHIQASDLADDGDAPHAVTDSHATQILTDRIEQLEFALGHLSETFSDNAMMIAGFDTRLDEISQQIAAALPAAEAPREESVKDTLKDELASLQRAMTQDHKTLQEQIDLLSTRPSPGSETESLRQAVEQNSAEMRALAEQFAHPPESVATASGCPESEAAIARFILAFRHLSRRTEALDQTIKAHLGVLGGADTAPAEDMPDTPPPPLELEDGAEPATAFDGLYDAPALPSADVTAEGEDAPSLAEAYSEYESFSALPGTDLPPQADVMDEAQDADAGLLDLPGAGPGMVWMLRQAGITSTAALAHANATDLAAELGMFGQLLDLTYWIETAKAQIST
ncbi:hypothetical protein E4Z66_08860 [Aliishimia ponticola]|uniref:Uncharacterized protein n=1 Tax=Aliishimia ponticola TaxID=2499833 RepID=A0A4S4NCD7_9RHOB|nr:hypothetical protein [Aliishimia ponticola]THH37039.1 hypothetical protein E4Z66_08860 [Aliishimia ponticola]